MVGSDCTSTVRAALYILASTGERANAAPKNRITTRSIGVPIAAILVRHEVNERWDDIGFSFSELIRL
jgi:hypothetical protein